MIGRQLPGGCPSGRLPPGCTGVPPDHRPAFEGAARLVPPGRLEALSKRYQQGRLFAFRTRNGILLGGRQEPLGCKDIDGLVVDGRTEWLSRCDPRFGI